MSTKAETIRSKFVNEAADLQKELASVLNSVGGSKQAPSMNKSEYDAILADGAFDILGIESLTTVKSAPQLAKAETIAAPAEPVAVQPFEEHAQEAPTPQEPPMAGVTEEGHSFAHFFQNEQPAASNRNVSVEMFA